METLPVASDPSQSFTVALGDSKFLFEIRWNDIAGFWTFDLTAEPSQVRLVAGAPILIGQDLFKPYALGIGGLVAYDSSGVGADAGADDLGDRVTLVWLSADELAAVKAAGGVL